jgi:hypothetical protein
LLAPPTPYFAGYIFPVNLPAERNFADLFAIVYRFGLPIRPRPPRRQLVAPPGNRREDRQAWPSFRHFQEAIMNDDTFNVSVRKFLKKIGVTSQREIEQAVRAAVSGGRLKGNETLPAKATLTIDGLGVSLQIEGAIELE